MVLTIGWGDALAGAGPWAITFGLFVSMFVAVQRGWVVPGKAHARELATRDREIKARDTALTTLTESHKAEVATLRERHDNYMTLMTANHAREIEGVRRDTADWRTAYHLAAEVSVTESTQLREIVEGIRLMLSLVESLPVTTHNHPRPEVTAPDGTRTG